MSSKRSARSDRCLLLLARRRVSLGLGGVVGRGLLVGVELESPERTEHVVNRMRDAGVLINRTGPHGNVMKIRPPIVFTSEHVSRLVGAS